MNGFVNVVSLVISSSWINNDAGSVLGSTSISVGSCCCCDNIACIICTPKVDGAGVSMINFSAISGSAFVLVPVVDIVASTVTSPLDIFGSTCTADASSFCTTTVTIFFTSLLLVSEFFSSAGSTASAGMASPPLTLVTLGDGRRHACTILGTILDTHGSTTSSNCPDPSSAVVKAECFVSYRMHLCPPN